jgi:hypothetical protein
LREFGCVRGDCCVYCDIQAVLPRQMSTN